MSTFFKGILAFGIVGAAALIGCAPPTGSGGGGGAAGDANANTTDGGNDNGGEGGQTSPGYEAFVANECNTCHTPEANNFSDSTIDDIVDTLLGEVPHTGGDLGDLGEEDGDAITEFLLDVMLGEDDLEGGGGEGDDDNVNDNAGGDDNENDNAGEDDNVNDNAGGDVPESRTWFEQVWTDFDENYSHFQTKGVDWDAVRQQYEPQFQAERTVEQFLAGIAGMLAELMDLHVWLLDTDGEAVTVYSKKAAVNYMNDLSSYFPGGLTQMQSFPLWHGRTGDNIAYIAIDSFVNDQWDGLRTGQVDDLFATYADAEAMIIDVRRNNGGDETIAAVFAGHLTDSSYVYGYHRNKNPGPDHDDFADFEEHRLEPAENNLFLKSAACLVGQRNMSTAEWFALMMRENPNDIALIGDTTRGSSGFPQEYELDNGVKYGIPIWEAYRADQTTEIEDVGIAPTEGYAIAADESFDTEHDYVLEKAIELLSP